VIHLGLAVGAGSVKLVAETDPGEIIMPIPFEESARGASSFVKAAVVFVAALIALTVWARPCAGQGADSRSPQLVVQTGPVVEVSTMTFSPDGRWLASDRNHLVCLWEATTGHLVRKLEGHTAKVNVLAFSPNGQLLASGSNDHSAILWDVATGRVQRRFVAPPGGIYQVAFSPDGRLLATGSGNGIAVWDVSSGKLLHGIGYDALKGHLFGFTSDGHSLIVESDTRIATWNLKLETLAWRTPVEKGEQRRILAASGDGRLLALQDSESNISIWDAEPNREVSKISSEPAGLRNPAAFSPDRKILACQSDRKDKAVRLWDVASGSELHALGNTLSTVLAFSPDGHKLAIASIGIAIWDVASGSPLQEMKRNVEQPLSIHIWETTAKRRPILLADSGSNFLQVWDLASGRPPRVERYDSSTSANYFEGADGTIVITDWQRGKRQFIDAVTGTKLPWLVELPLSTEWKMNSDATLVAVTERAENEQNDQKQVLIHIKEVVTGHEVTSFISKTKDVGKMVFSKDNRWLLTTSFFDRRGDLWDLRSGGSKYQFQGEEIILSPDGRWVASCASGEGITVLELQTQIKRSYSRNCGITFSPNGRYLAAGHDGPIDVWEIESGRRVLSLDLSGTTGGKFFSPDERYLVTDTIQKQDQLWEISTGREILPNVSQLIRRWATMSFSEDSHWLAAAGSDGSIKIWNLDAEKLVASLYLLDDGESWLATTPDGYFDGTDSAVKKLVAWNLGNQIYPAARFAKQRYRPGLLVGIFAKTGLKP